MIKSVRGTRDLLPPETALWNFVEAAARDVFRDYNFHEIRTPIFEDLALFQRSVGEETDIVSKEMFAWQDRGRARSVSTSGSGPRSGSVSTSGSGPRSGSVSTSGSGPRSGSASIPGSGPAEGDQGQMLALRPENTAGVVRAYIEHKMWERPGVQKLYYIGPQFRRERPQKGRYRQFYQIGAEAIGPPAAGSESPARDAEILEMLATLLDRLGIENWTLQLNSVGCANDRPRYHEALRKALSPVVAKMCADCQRRAATNPLRVFDCKVPEDQPIIARLPTISAYLDESCRAHFAEVHRILTALNIPFVLNDRLVRGLDYYQKTAFEFTHGALGAQNAILGGGRYDGLSETLGGPRAPGIGFAIGEDRLILSLKETAEALAKKPEAYIAPLGAGTNAEAAKLAHELRQHDLIIELGDESFRLKKSLETASKVGARYVVIVGENEIKAGAFALKNLSTGEQVTVARADLPVRIRA